MEPVICSRCKKNIAVIFITRLDGNESRNEGLCLKCARELHIKPVDDAIAKMGLSDEDLDNLTDDMAAMFSGEGLAALQAAAEETEDDDDAGKTATFPFLSRLMGQSAAQQGAESNPGAQNGKNDGQRPGGKENRGAKKKFLDAY